MDRPLVSVSCLTYNHEPYIRQALDSFLMQETDFPIEILIHDDCSTDHTAEILHEYEEKYPGIVLPLYEEHNQFMSGNRNINYRYNYSRARGKYIAYCEGDDYWLDPHKLQKQVDYMEAHPDCSLTFHAVNDVDGNGNFLREFHPYSENRLVSMEESLTASRVYTFASFVFRTQDVMDYPDYCANSPIGDIPIIAMLTSKGDVYYMDEIMACYRNQSTGSWTSRLWSGPDYKEKVKKHLDDMRTMYRAFNEATGHKYDQEVSLALKKMDFEYHLGMDDFRQVCSPEYRTFFEKLSLQARIGARIGAVSPALFYLLKPKKK